MSTLHSHDNTESQTSHVGAEPVHSQQLTDILEQANSHMERAEYEAAVTAFEAAADKLTNYDRTLRRAIDTTIQKMALPGCAATPPLPQVRHMIVLRNRL